MAIENIGDDYKTIGSHRVHADFTASPNDKDVMVTDFFVTCTVPSAPVAPHDQTSIKIWSGLRAYNSSDQIRLTLGWDPDFHWYVNSTYRRSDGILIGGSLYKVQPGQKIALDIVFNGKDDKFKYTTHSRIGIEKGFYDEYEVPCALNQPVLSLDLESSDYRNLPPDRDVYMDQVSVALAPAYGSQLFDKIHWQYETHGVLIPSGRLGISSNNTYAEGDMRFGFR